VSIPDAKQFHSKGELPDGAVAAQPAEISAPPSPTRKLDAATKARLRQLEAECDQQLAELRAQLEELERPTSRLDRYSSDLGGILSKIHALEK
jgi:hypothetical protein